MVLMERNSLDFVKKGLNLIMNLRFFVHIIDFMIICMYRLRHNISRNGESCKGSWFIEDFVGENDFYRFTVLFPYLYDTEGNTSIYKRYSDYVVFKTLNTHERKTEYIEVYVDEEREDGSIISISFYRNKSDIGNPKEFLPIEDN